MSVLDKRYSCCLETYKKQNRTDDIWQKRMCSLVTAKARAFNMVDSDH
jgi:hypothetical protein